jgi:hypothetical protein
VILRNEEVIVKLTLAQRLAWKRFLTDLAKVAVPVLLAVMSSPEQMAQLGLPARWIIGITLIVLPVATGLYKLRKETRRGN